jgi:AbrB family looped-hinge helix DNA binding protein
MERLFMDNAKVMAKGQVTIPKEVREVLRVKNGDKVTFIVEGENVRVVNAAVYAMEMFAREMRGEAEKAGINSDDDVIALIKELRSESADQ